jgi:hypothetical protein
VKFAFPGDNDTADDEKEDKMTQERSRHTQEPAEGSDEDVGAQAPSEPGRPTKMRRDPNHPSIPMSLPKAAKKT